MCQRSIGSSAKTTQTPRPPVVRTKGKQLNGTLAHKAAVGRLLAIQAADVQQVGSKPVTVQLQSPSKKEFPSIESVLAAFDRSAPLINAA